VKKARQGAAIKQRDVTRLLRAATAAGRKVSYVDAYPAEGKIRMVLGDGTELAASELEPTALDAWRDLRIPSSALGAYKFLGNPFNYGGLLLDYVFRGQVQFFPHGK
jgi:hypothetical protein